VTPTQPKRDISGWIIVDKPLGMTSTQAVGKVRWLCGAKKAGHAGTLDPLATGILPIALGEATKTVPLVQDGTKSYRFSLKWGEATDTADAEGEVIATSDVRPSEAEVLALLPRFIGEIAQTPPIYSALKVGGERAYDLARAGEEVALEPRQVRVDALSLLLHSEAASDFEVICGKGTYIRSLGPDIAAALGSVGHISALRRTAVGPFTLKDSVTIEALEAGADRDALLRPVAAGLAGVPEVRLDGAQVTAIRNGQAVLLTGARAPIALAEAWASHAGAAIALGAVENGMFKPRRVLN
jgi:tRNA pseudouridine55 synthase